MEKLKELRKEKGLTQQDMAKRIGFTLSMYEKVEGGRVKASAAFMRAVKKAFPDANIDFIFFDANSNDVAENAASEAF